MRNDQLAVFRGALHQVKAMSGVMSHAHLEAVQINDVEWATFQQAEWWQPEEAIQAQLTMSKLVSLGYRLSGAPAIAVTAEYIAAAIVSFVHPVNWNTIAALSAGGLDGTKILTSNGDEIEARESVNGEQLYVLVLAMSQMPDAIFRPMGDPNAEETQQQP